MTSVQQMAAVGQVLTNPGLDLSQRFRALFTLKNLGGNTAVNMSCLTLNVSGGKGVSMV